MPTQIQDISTPDWQLSLSGFGEVVTDIADIWQCVGIIILTRKGDVPLDPYFGSLVLDYLDKPINRALPAIVADLIENIGTYEKRIIVTNVSYNISDSGAAEVKITATQVRTANEISYTFYINRR